MAVRRTVCLVAVALAATIAAPASWTSYAARLDRSMLLLANGTAEFLKEPEEASPSLADLGF